VGSLSDASLSFIRTNLCNDASSRWMKSKRRSNSVSVIVEEEWLPVGARSGSVIRRMILSERSPSSGVASQR